MLKNRTKYLLFFLFIITFLACSKRPSNVLTVREMTDILIDLHTLDGIMVTHEFRHVSEEERNLFYEAVLIRHNTTQAQFDSSVVWYTRDPRQFERIYNRVLNQLTLNLEQLTLANVEVAQLPVFSSQELWKEEMDFYLVYPASERVEPTFTIIDSSLMMQDLYILCFYQRVLPDDLCAKQRIVFSIHYANGEIDSLIHLTQHDGLIQRNTMRLFADQEARIDSLTVRFFVTDGCDYPQNSRLNIVRLTRKFNPEIQEGMREKTELIERFRNFEFRLFPIPSERNRFFLTTTNEQELQEDLQYHIFIEQNEQND